MYTLRALPRVAELEARLAKISAHPNPQWAPERDGLGEAVAALSKRLFGIEEEDTEYIEVPDDRDEADLNRCIEAFDADLETRVLIEDDAKVLTFFAARQWDVSDGQGQLLEAEGHFYRQILAATHRVCGRLPGAEMSDAEAQEAATTWAASLENEARRFRGGS